MSRYSHYNKNDTYLANLNYANAQKERRNKEELKEIEQDRIAMEKLQIELNKEKQLEKERKNLIRQQQYEDYSNYVKQKYSQTPQTKENVNIKVGSGQRFIRKPSYQQQMDNLCLNPTRNTNVYAHTPIPNFSEQGRRYQRGYSHGYNILTGEAYSSELYQNKSNQNININNNINDNRPKEQKQNNYVINDEKEKEELRQYQEYMEMKRKKEQQEQEEQALYYMQQQNQNKYPLSQEKEMPKEREIINQKDIPEQYQNIPQSQNQYDNEYSNKEQTYDKIRPNENNINSDIPPEYQDLYKNERFPSNRMQQPPLDEIPPEYREIYLREQMRENEQRPPYQNQKEEINNYKPKQEENQKPNENINTINSDKIKERDNYRQYLLSKQEINEKEKEEENMEIYQNMLKEKELEQNQMNQEKEKEIYRRYLLEQQRQEQSQIREKEINQNQINDNKNQQYQDINDIREADIPKEDMINKNNKPINSFEEYYRQKNDNIQEVPSQMNNQQQEQIGDNYENNEKNLPYSQYPPEIPQNPNIYPQSQEPLSEEQAYMMYQQQQNRKDLEQMEMEKERARILLEKQQREQLNQEQIPNQNDYYPQNYNNESPYYNNNSREQVKMSEFNSAKMEYLKNKQKNLLTKDNIFSISETPKPQPKYRNEPLTNADRLRIQREYAQFLDSQINAKSMRENKNKNNGLNMVQSSGYEVEGPNPYEQMRNKHSKLRDIPQDPYSVKNYNISSNSYLASNPITNPVNSYKFVDKRRVPSGRLQNSGSNIVGK